MTMDKAQRKENLMPDGIPKWIRVFDNGGKTFDRYTVIFTHAHSFGLRGYTVGVGMSEHPFHPQGFGQHFEYQNHKYDGKSGGKRIGFNDLPPDCKRLVIDDYTDYWRLKP
jgi:hypothetical protein